MARPVSLSDEAFRVLRAEKGPHESDSDVVLRLAREARKRRKDPGAFFRAPPRPGWTPEQHDAFADAMRAADLRKAADAQRPGAAAEE